MKRLRKPPEQTPFIIIFACQRRRYRNVILAYDVDEAREKAVQMAATLAGNFEVRAVRRADVRAPTENAMAELEAMSADEGRDRGLARAG